jgi:hypothetical protein
MYQSNQAVAQGWSWGKIQAMVEGVHHCLKWDGKGLQEVGQVDGAKEVHSAYCKTEPPNS